MLRALVPAEDARDSEVGDIDAEVDKIRLTEFTSGLVLPHHPLLQFLLFLHSCVCVHSCPALNAGLWVQAVACSPGRDPQGFAAFAR
jgi:hypothetical protein